MNALKININCRLIRHYSRFFHTQGQRDLFSLGSVSGSMASVCDGFDLLGAWLERAHFKRGTSPLTLMDLRAILVSERVSPLSCGGTDRGWPNNLPIPSQEMQRRQKNV